MEIESYLEMLDKYECSQWFIGQVLGGMFTIVVFTIILITFCINLTLYFTDYLKCKGEKK